MVGKACKCRHQMGLKGMGRPRFERGTIGLKVLRFSRLIQALRRSMPTRFALFINGIVRRSERAVGRR